MIYCSQTGGMLLLRQVASYSRYILVLYLDPNMDDRMLFGMCIKAFTEFCIRLTMGCHPIRKRLIFYPNILERDTNIEQD